MSLASTDLEIAYRDCCSQMFAELSDIISRREEQPPFSYPPESQFSAADCQDKALVSPSSLTSAVAAGSETSSLQG